MRRAVASAPRLGVGTSTRGVDATSMGSCGLAAGVRRTSTDASSSYRVERDFLGEVHVPRWALWGAATARAVDNFAVTGQTVLMPDAVVRALAQIKARRAGDERRRTRC